MIKRCINLIAVSAMALLLILDPAMARSIGFQPRLEMGVMQYEFESEALSRSISSIFYNKTFSSFTYEDVLPFVSSGVTVFTHRVFVDVSAQYAFDGNDSTNPTRSTFHIDSYDQETNFLSSRFLAYSPQNEVSFDRRDIGISLGYCLTSDLSIFAGYKMTETRFREKYDGRYSLIEFDGDNTADDIDYIGGRMWGVGTYKFVYSGPFIGFIHGWDFSDARILKGIITANVALAFLEGKLKFNNDVSHMSVIWVDDQQIPEYLLSGSTSQFTNRGDVKGDALGLKVSLSWNGVTPWEDLSYTIGISGYRYEFDASGIDSDMSETAIKFKVGLYYVF